MREQVRPILGLVITSFTLAPLALARQVVVQSESPLRGGPNRTFRSIGVVTVGTTAEAMGQTAGWVQIKLEDGRVGYVFQGNLRDVPESPVAGVATTTDRKSVV